MPAPLLKARPPLLKTKSKWGTLQLPEGKFIGEILTGQQSQQGSSGQSGQAGHYGQLTYWNGDYYEGEFNHGHPEGRGSIDYQDGTKYRGDFKKGLPHGHGMKQSPNQVTFVGSFANGRENGAGILAVIKQGKNGVHEHYYAEYKNGKHVYHNKINRSNPSVIKAMDMIYEFEGEED